MRRVSLAEKKKRKVAGKNRKKMYQINFASVLTYGLCSCVDWLPQIQHSNVTRELFLTPAW